ncbi:hypothetical protein G7B40_001645 [Aetokthonos hydrillicola Thurmond2011]|jgi:hypothetical protein|uniref:Uncharacterized protein n=1 Tax=Aetokthonos hydrillicola Thurmond2011 TaxID=2712845 RepID=A0AAP5I238_9CYAN|nr:hypothetical protein [Aetokthonos hydrillicola]MBO3462974.1 hypothetical protein [Aetokthonos hydrillicola CCALA 1050]MBW4591270.1 hypothetical protein [Aetokthonos hydrillicola CCALA 1050]MDR9893290.1 hypothetical protein [Aetokthonos hydrillicola Thurmond2011]
MARKIVTPIYYQIYKRVGATWIVKDPSQVFYNPSSEQTDLQKIARLFDTTEQAVIIELFRLNGGQPGYYLANLKDKKYYYCGTWEGVKQKLLELGIGRVDPMEKYDG